MMHELAVAAGGFVAAHPRMAVTFLLVGGYLLSLVLHPYTNCQACKGSGRRRAGLFTYSWGNCNTCGGMGRKYRLGVRALGIGPGGAEIRARRNNPDR